jgi:predicted ATPase
MQGVPAFVGRTEPLARLSAAYQAIADKTPSTAPDVAGSIWAGLILVTGEAGIGKTALLTRFAGQVAADGGSVVWGTCWEADQTPAWWPWTQALRALLDRSALAEAAPAELAAIVPELASIQTVIGSDAAARVRVFDAAAQVLRRASASAPVIVIIDDLHWADRSTMDLLRRVLRRQQRGVGTARGRRTALAELRRATRPGGSSRSLSNTASERARKAVTARIRDAIRRISDAHPELGIHLDRTILTGTTCRYEPDRAGR